MTIINFLAITSLLTAFMCACISIHVWFSTTRGMIVNCYTKFNVTVSCSGCTNRLSNNTDTKVQTIVDLSHKIMYQVMVSLLARRF